MASYSVKDGEIESIPDTTTASDRIHARVWITKYRWVWITLILLAVFAVAFVVGYEVARGIHSSSDDPVSLPPQQYSLQVSESIRAAVTSADIDDNLKRFTEVVHPAGKTDNEILGTTLADMWKGVGLTVHIFNYSDVFVQYPLSASPNLVEILDGSTTVSKTTNSDSYFSGYSAVGSEVGKLIYVNFGTAGDFTTLTQHVPCSSTVGTRYVVIARFGDRKPILKRAEEWCRPSATSTSPIAALLLYGDPAEYANDTARVWPNGPGVRGSDAMFGAMLTGTGDPLSTGLPSIDGVYRADESEAQVTKLLVQPISYADAAMLMKDLNGTSPPGWKGTMDTSYNTGPGYSGALSGRLVRVNINADPKTRATMKNIVAVIPGNAEHDRYIIIGAHYDAWTFGASDPNGATSVLGRMAIAFKRQVDSGWKPRRTIIFAHWDGEQFRKIGSQEFADQFGPEIQKRTVAYINLDTLVIGNHTFHAYGHPLLADVIYEATKLYKFPGDSDTVYTHWGKRSTPNVLAQPPVDPAGVRGDLWPFWSPYGVPYLFPYFNGPNGVNQSPFRYTMLDTHEMISKYVDPGFKFHELFGRIMTDTILRLSDSAVLPYSFVSFAETLRYRYNITVAVKEMNYNEAIRVYIRNVLTTLNDFVSAANSFTQTVAQQSSSLDDTKLRAFNDKIMMVPQVFNSLYNLEYRKITSLLYGADSYTESTTVYFPGVTNAMTDITSTDSAIRIRGETMMKRELSALYVALRQATSILRSQTLSD